MSRQTQKAMLPVHFLRTAAILHTDLDASLLALLTRRLESAGYRTEVVRPSGHEDGDEAMRLRDAVKNHDLLILDDKIGGHTALEYILFLKSRETQHIPMILLQSEPETYLTAAAYFVAGFERVLQKDDTQAMERLFRKQEQREWAYDWNVYTQGARQALHIAQDMAMRQKVLCAPLAGISMRDTYLSTEHLLEGLASEEDGAAMLLLENYCGVSPKHVWDEILTQTNSDLRLANAPSTDETLSVKLTPRSKVVLYLAAEEARALGSSHVGSEHLLLGLMREGDGFGARVLTKLGVNLDRARVAVCDV